MVESNDPVAVQGGGEDAVERPRLSRSLRWLEQGLWLGVLFGSVLLLGGVLPWSLWCLAVLALCALLLTSRRRQLKMGAGAWVLLACAGVAALQCLPLPRGLVALVDPASAAIWERAQQLTRSEGALPFSLDPEATRMEVLKALLYAAVWVGAAALRRRWGLRPWLAAIAGLALLCGGLTALHRVLSLTKVYGVYAPDYAHQGSLGPLMNPNTQGGLYVLGAFAAVGLALHQKTSKRQAAVSWGAASTLLALVVVTGSRGALMAIAVGIGTLLIAVRQQFALLGGGAKANAVAGGITVVAAFALSVAAMTTTLAAQLWDGSVEKLQLWLWGWELALEHPWLGVGRGAFGADVARVAAVPGEVVFIHAENWVVEWLAGFGLVVGGALVFALVRGLWPKAAPDRRWQPSDWALYSGLVAVTAQNLTDLSFEVPGLAVPFVFAFAASSERTKGPSSRSQVTSKSTWKRLEPGWALATLLGLGALWTMVSPVTLAHRERKQLSERFWGPPQMLPTLDEISRAVRRHPADAHLLRLGAQRLLYEEPARGIAWLNASLLQAPRAGRTYLLLGQTLARLGRTDQALVSLREAAQHAKELSPTVAALARRWSKDHVLRAVPEGVAGAPVLLELALQSPSGAEKISLLQQAEVRDPELLGLAEARIEAELDAIAAKSSPCDAGHTEECLRRVGEALDRLEPRALTPRRVSLRARWLDASGRLDEALTWLTARCPRNSEGRPCLELLLGLAARKDTAAASRAAEILTGSCAAGNECVSALRRVAQVFRARGEAVLSLSYQQRVVEADPSWSNWLDLALLARDQGRTVEAERAFERAAREAGDDLVAVQRVSDARKR